MLKPVRQNWVTFPDTDLVFHIHAGPDSKLLSNAGDFSTGSLFKEPVRFLSQFHVDLGLIDQCQDPGSITLAKTVAQDFWEMGTNYTLKYNVKSL